jgi:hypothetical protein
VRQGAFASEGMWLKTTKSSGCALRQYHLEDSFDRKLLDLDRQIHNMASVAAA